MAARRPAAERTAFLRGTRPLNRLVHDAVGARGGSISAEHGIGVLKRDELGTHKSPVELKLMRAIKAALDPRADEPGASASAASHAVKACTSGRRAAPAVTSMQ